MSTEQDSIPPPDGAQSVSFRLDASVLKRLEAIGQTIGMGMRPNRSQLLRLAIERGISLLESELDLSKDVESSDVPYRVQQ